MENLNGLVLFLLGMALPTVCRPRIIAMKAFITMSHREAIPCQTCWHCATRG